MRGYYALPLLWGDQVIGWSNVSVADGALLADELERMAEFLL